MKASDKDKMLGASVIVIVIIAFITMLVNAYDKSETDRKSAFISYADKLDGYGARRIKCAWSSEYQVCFCEFSAGWEGGLFTYVPNRVCGKPNVLPVEGE